MVALNLPSMTHCYWYWFWPGAVIVRRQRVNISEVYYSLVSPQWPKLIFNFFIVDSWFSKKTKHMLPIWLRSPHSQLCATENTEYLELPCKLVILKINLFWSTRTLMFRTHLNSWSLQCACVCVLFPLKWTNCVIRSAVVLFIVLFAVHCYY